MQSHGDVAARVKREAVKALSVCGTSGQSPLFQMLCFKQIIDFPNEFQELVRIFFIGGQSA